MLGVKGIWEAHGPLRENSRGKLQNVVRNSREKATAKLCTDLTTMVDDPDTAAVGSQVVDPRFREWGVLLNFAS